MTSATNMAQSPPIRIRAARESASSGVEGGNAVAIAARNPAAYAGRTGAIAAAARMCSRLEGRRFMALRIPRGLYPVASRRVSGAFATLVPGALVANGPLWQAPGVALASRH